MKKIRQFHMNSTELERIRFGEPSQDECKTCRACALRVKESSENND